MREVLRDALLQLTRALDRSQAARDLLRGALALARDRAPALALAEDLEELRVLRALLHLREDSAYVGLLVEPADEGAADLQASASAWRLVSTRQAPVSCDLATGAARAQGLTLALDEPAQAPISRETVRRLKRREVTHFHARPLIAPGPALLGMLVIEVDCPDAAGVDFGLWAALEDDLTVLCAMGAAALALLPGAAPGSAEDAGPLPALSPAMAPVLGVLRRLAPGDATVLLTGETGVGKTRLARWLHEGSPRAGAPFVAADIASLPEDLATARLFGATRGAWTGQTKEQQGAVERAAGGTLLLDEVGDLSPAMQLRLLRLLDEGVYLRLGEDEERRASCRVIACTCVDLQAALRAGRFRADLYQRLATFPVRIPPLRDRPRELPGWCERFAREVPGGPLRLAPELVEALCRRPWEGNLRELKAKIERLAVLAERGRADLDTLQAEARAFGERSSAGGVGEGLAEAARALVAVSGEGVDVGLDACKGAFAGVVVAAALAAEGSVPAAALRLGLDPARPGGNHRATMRRYLGHADALLQALGEPWPEGLPSQLE